MKHELANLDATAQAELIRRREVSPLELVDTAIAAIEKLNPQLNAVVTPLFDKARALARSGSIPDGPFRGVPFLLKDLGACRVAIRSIPGCGSCAICISSRRTTPTWRP